MPRLLLLSLLVLSGACRAPSPEVRPDPAPREPVARAPVSAAPSAAPPPEAVPEVYPDSSAAAARRDLPPDPSAAALASAAPAASAMPGGPCVIKVTALLEAEIFRGVPRSQARQATLDHLAPAERDRWHGRDHGVTYLQCRYAVTMKGRRFTHDHVAGQGMLFDHQLKVEQCSLPAEMRKVEADLKETTKQCSDPHAGAYWGFDLVEAP